MLSIFVNIVSRNTYFLFGLGLAGGVSVAPASAASPAAGTGGGAAASVGASEPSPSASASPPSPGALFLGRPFGFLKTGKTKLQLLAHERQHKNE